VLTVGQDSILREKPKDPRVHRLCHADRSKVRRRDPVLGRPEPIAATQSGDRPQDEAAPAPHIGQPSCSKPQAEPKTDP